jgi:hypothetical protein
MAKKPQQSVIDKQLPQGTTAEQPEQPEQPECMVMLTAPLEWSPDGIRIIKYASGEQLLPHRASEVAAQLGIIKADA